MRIRRAFRRHDPRRLQAVVLAVGVSASLGLGAIPSGAALPGLNGRIVFSSYQDSAALEIYSILPDGSAESQRRLTNNTAHDWSPAWSPDGTKIAFVSNRNPKFEQDVYVMPADGGPATRLTADRGDEQHPSYSPNQEKIIFVREVRNLYDLWIMDADGENERSLLATRRAEEMAPSFSPDGTRVAFSSNMDGDHDVYTMRADGTGPLEQLTNAPGGDWPGDWSPDGTMITFVSERNDTGDIYTVRLSDGFLQQLTSEPGGQWAPDWSPDGNRIVFADYGPNTALHDAEIWTMNASDGGARTRLTTNLRGDFQPDWQTGLPL